MISKLQRKRLPTIGASLTNERQSLTQSSASLAISGDNGFSHFNIWESMSENSEPISNRPLNVTMWAAFYALASILSVAVGIKCSVSTGGSILQSVIFIGGGLVLSVACLMIAFGLFTGMKYAWRFCVSQRFLAESFQSEEVRSFFGVESHDENRK